MTRVMLVVFTVATGGATYATVTGVGAESSAISQSVRSGSAGRIGGGGYIGRVK